MYPGKIKWLAASICIPVLILGAYSVSHAGTGLQADPDYPLLDRPGTVENLHRDARPPGDDTVQPGSYGYHDRESHDHDHNLYYTDRHDDKIIHITDYLYRVPEIREAYEAYLRMKKEAPEELLVMQHTTTYQVGDTRNFFVFNIEKSQPGSPPVYDEILFELRSIGKKSEIWVEQDELAPDKITDQVVMAMMEALEERTPPRSVNPNQGIILNNIDIFAQGEPRLVPDPDGSGVIKVLIANIQDGWDPDEGGGYTAGFFNPGDLVPKAANRHSNEAAILYINSYPGIYLDNQPANPNRPLNVIAHEHQHLIQAGRGNLGTFMDEGQSEVAEIFNGFNARSMVFLNEPDEVSGNVESRARDGFLRWRTGEPEVLKDYQRAQLFHSYLYERAGLEAVGSLTQSGSGNPWVQYQAMLTNATTGLDFREVLADFHVTNWLNDTDVNDGRFGYTLPQQSGVRATVPGTRFDGDSRSWINNEPVSLHYGGAKYIQWRHIQDLSLRFSNHTGISHYLILEREGRNVKPEVLNIEGSEISVDGFFTSAVLVSVNTLVQDHGNFGSRQFTYTAEWIPSDLTVVDISYSVTPVAGWISFPMFHSSSQTEFRTVAVRVDPEYDGVLQGVDVNLHHTAEAVTGSGSLQVSVTESDLLSGTGADALYVPSRVLASVVIDFEDLRPGVNSIDFSDFDVEMDARVNYHIHFEILNESADGRIRFTFDQGSNDKANRNYYPVRTILGGFSAGTFGWSRLIGDKDNESDNDNKNLFLTTRVLSRVPVEGLPERPVTERFELLSNYPNPFNNTTRIRFNIPDNLDDETRVQIQLYDILGRHVRSIMDQNQPSGVHEITVDAQGLSSGIYIVRMLAGGGADSRKIMFLK